MNTLRQDILPPSGVEFATHLKLTPSCNGDQQQLSTRHEFVARVLCNLAVARSNLLRISEVREEPWTPPAGAEDERERKGHVRRGTEAVEGESAMDTDGDGFINLSQGMTMKNDIVPPTRTRLYLVREHRLHGTVTGLEGVKIIASLEDKLDRLLISFKDAKIALLEWSDSVHDLVPVSIHTYERAPQLLSLTAPLFRATLQVLPIPQCLLPSPRLSARSRSSLERVPTSVPHHGTSPKSRLSALRATESSLDPRCAHGSQPPQHRPSRSLEFLDMTHASRTVTSRTDHRSRHFAGLCVAGVEDDGRHREKADRSCIRPKCIVVINDSVSFSFTSTRLPDDKVGSVGLVEHPRVKDLSQFK
ncbi:hypothetical protein BKA70DRAFT_1402186 [Coprinopsis sp. MPI-PUGE-AT-0042]|nr:hypothetical protein BKA70DRAFT_1402186 [Coprinopsis sp. MPI-PUGE-AT-0042]